MRADSVRRPRARRLGDGDLGAAARRARPRPGRDLVGRRRDPAPARRRRAAARGPRDARPGRARGAGHRRARQHGAVRLALPRGGRALAADPAPHARPPHAAVAAAAEGAGPAAGRAPLRRVPGGARDLPRVPAGLARPARAEDAARAPRAPRGRAGRGRDADRLAVRAEPAVRLHRDLHVRGRRAARGAARRGAGARPRPAARAARRRGAARADRPRALATVEEELQRLAPARAAADADQLHDLLRTLGDLSDASCRRASCPGIDAQRARGAARERAARGEGAARRRAALDRRRRRGALPRRARRRAARPGCRSGSCEPVDGALEKLLRRYARTHGPFTTAEVAERYGLAAAATTRGPDARSSAPRSWCAARSGPRPTRAPAASASGATPTCCGACGARASRRCARRSSPPTRRRWRASRSSWHGIDRYARSGREGRRASAMPLDAGARPPARGARPAQGLALTPETWERDVLPRRLGSYDRTWLDRLCAAGEVVWTGAGSGCGRGGRVALYFREDAPFLGPAAGAARARAARPRRTTRCASGSPAAPPSGRTCWSTSTSRRSTCATRSGTWCGQAR